MRKTCGWWAIASGLVACAVAAGAGPATAPVPTTVPTTTPSTGPTATAGTPEVAAAGHGLRCEAWDRDVPDGDAADLIADGLLDRPAERTWHVDAFALPPKETPAVAMAVRGYLTVPATGEYRFAVSAHDSAVLYVSGDELPGHREMVATVPAYVPEREYHWYEAQQSRAIPLVAGRRYFVEAIVKNVVGQCHLSVAWTTPGGPKDAAIPAEDLTPVDGAIVPPNGAVSVRRLVLRQKAAVGLGKGFHKFVRGATVQLSSGEQFEMSYLLYTPAAFAASPDRRVPLLVFLHGNGHQGYDLAGVSNEGPPLYMGQDPKLRDWMPMAVLVPQLPPGWRWDRPGAAAAVNALVEQVCLKYPAVDRRRLYLTGLSMGGKGTWLTALDDPDRYAAVATVSAVAVRPEVAKVKLAALPRLRMICGGDDGDFAAGTQLMFKELKPVLGDRIKITVCPNEGHGVWYHWYQDRKFYEDLMGASR